MRIFMHCCWECKMVQLLWKTEWWLIRKWKTELSYDPAILLQGTSAKERKAGSLRILVWVAAFRKHNSQGCSQTCSPSSPSMQPSPALTQLKHCTYPMKGNRQSQNANRCMPPRPWAHEQPRLPRTESRVAGGRLGMSAVLLLQMKVIPLRMYKWLT